MYSVHAVVFRTLNGDTTRHEVLIHDNMSPSLEQHLIDPKLKLADSTAGTFTATITPYNPGYSLIERFNSIIKIHKGDKLIWTGRVLSESMDFWNRRTIACEGALAFLNDTIQPIAYYGSGRSPAYIIQTLLSIHNQKTVTDRKLYLGTVSGFSDEEYNNYIFQTNNGNTWEELKTNLLDRFDGHLTIHYTNEKAYVDFFEDYPNTAIQQINFGDNLLDFTRDWNLTNLATVILPRGATLDADTAEGQKSYITLKSTTESGEPVQDGQYSIGNELNAITVEGQYIISNTLYSQYGRVEKIVDFNDSTSASDLFTLAKNYIASMQFDELTLTVSAVDLHTLTKNIISFELLDEVYCVSRPHGLYGKYFPITEIDIPLDKPENTTYTLSSSSTRTGFTNTFGNFKSKTTAAFKNLSTTGHILDLARSEASSIINRKTTGYVNVINMFDNDEEGVAQAIVISNNPEWKQASKYWIWNMNGLAYYSASRSAEIANTIGTSNAYPYREADSSNFESTRYYDMAITMDGTIVANHIKTGILSDGMGYNYWNLETGEFSLQPNTKFQYGSGAGEYQTVYDLIWRTDAAYNKRTGATNYLNGTKDWAEWRWSGNWHKDENDQQIMICDSKYSSSWTDVLMTPVHNIEYISIKGYTMTFSIEGCMSESGSWGDIESDNAVVISFSIVTSSGIRLAKLDKLFSFGSDWSRRYVSIDVLDSSFTSEGGSSLGYDYDSAYLDIWIYNRSTHGLYLRRPQFERGNTPTDWGMSEADVDKEAKAKADKAENNSKGYAEQIANKAATDAYAQAKDDLDKLNNKVIQEYVPSISDSLKSFTKDEVSAINRSLNQEEILDRLTGKKYGNETVGFYLLGNELYMNASYIRSGTLDAGLLKAGVIYAGRDSLQRNNNYWDLTRGILKTENSVFTNAEITGSLESTSEDGNNIRIGEGAIMGFARGGTSVIAPTSFNQQSSSGSWRTTSGLFIQTTGRLSIACENLRIGRPMGSNSMSTTEVPQEETVSIKYIVNAWLDGDDNIKFHKQQLTLYFVHGLLVHWVDEGVD